MEYEKVIAEEACRAIAEEYQPEDLEDLLQEARVKVFARSEQIARARKPLALCRVIARNEMRDWLRREARQRHQPLLAEN